MPYIKPEKRPPIDKLVDKLIKLLEQSPQEEISGDLNYTITRILSGTLHLDEARYNKINTAIGILGCVEHELYLRIAQPYEQIKCEQNTDVPEYKKFKEQHAVSGSRGSRGSHVQGVRANQRNLVRPMPDS